MDITVRISENDDNFYIFVFNYSNETQSGELHLKGDINKTFNISVSPVGYDIITESLERTGRNRSKGVKSPKKLKKVLKRY